MVSGYLNRPDERGVSFRDGWFYTGDIAVMDETGFFQIVDRKKDLVIVSGFNVYPNEVEAVLAEHPDMVEVAVIGVPDEQTGEAVRAMEMGVQQVEKGAASSQKSGHALEEILGRISEVSMQISQIATAAEEQTATTSEVAMNIQQITEVVHQTARGAEETSKAAADLNGQAQRLQTLVSRFRLA